MQFIETEATTPGNQYALLKQCLRVDSLESLPWPQITFTVRKQVQSCFHDSGAQANRGQGVEQRQSPMFVHVHVTSRGQRQPRRQ